MPSYVPESNEIDPRTPYSIFISVHLVLTNATGHWSLEAVRWCQQLLFSSTLPTVRIQITNNKQADVVPVQFIFFWFLFKAPSCHYTANDLCNTRTCLSAATHCVPLEMWPLKLEAVRSYRPCFGSGTLGGSGSLSGSYTHTHTHTHTHTSRPFKRGEKLFKCTCLRWRAPTAGLPA